MKINRHFVKNIVLTISWGILTFITDSLIINYYCIDPGNIKSTELSDFYELEMCVQSKEIIIDSIYIFAGLLAIIGLYQLISSIRQKKDPNQIDDAKNLSSAAKALIAISVSLFIIIKTSIAF